MKKIHGYFSIDGVPWTVFKEEGDFGDNKGVEFSTNAQGHFIIDGSTAIHSISPLESKDRVEKREYEIFTSLMSLAINEECKDVGNDDDSVTLQQAVNATHLQAESFRSMWIANNITNPEEFPLWLPSNNAGSFFEQLFDHEPEDC